jgi:hypothetical protein
MSAHQVDHPAPVFGCEACIADEKGPPGCMDGGGRRVEYRTREQEVGEHVAHMERHVAELRRQGVR